ncbi:SDR family oxidoreductase [Thalassobaculum litoreum]|uniref:NAD(P)-dependent dehydrogenase, short-chain alcohol dehydrogenase family n=1 Tax=Thalassobaculum litoreum DSM 18839 TaxID=1123362 RepID=A0A8G2BM80_9PROT|nr:SDR family oxidoreductase [Thalassobaculum litoreum]SDG08126.1 NAD(P)-dependent dehydrogenase, short-chain alcohol dehydrogenase family [Thalassobaculum litoreum DSM 18839]
MSDKVLIVTGGSRGIGAATCRLAAAQGWDVAINYTANATAAEAVAKQVTDAGRRAITVKGDMASEADILSLFETAEKELGPVGGVVANAGITGKITRVEDMSTAAMQEVINLNVIGLMITNREAVRRMSTKRGGKGGPIVNTSSIAPRVGSPNEFVHYAASKGAVDAWTLGLAREVAGEGIRVNAVAPGMIDTDIHATAGAPDRASRLGALVPIGRAGTAEEVAEAIVWLLSDHAAYCVGTVLEVNGGR